MNFFQHVFIVGFLCFSPHIGSQNTIINLFKSDTLTFLEGNNKLKLQINNYSPEKQDSILNVFISESQEGHIPKLEAASYYRLANIQKNYALANEIDSLINRSIFILKTIKDSVGIAYCELFLGKYLFNINSIKANLYTNHALNTFISNKDTLGMAECFNNIGKIYSETGNYQFAEIKFEQALKLCYNSMDYKKYTIPYQLNLGVVLIKKEDFRKALDEFLDLEIKISESDNYNQKEFLYNNISSCYRELNNLILAEKYLKLAIEINENSNNTKSLANNYHNLTTLYITKGEYNLAISCAHQSLNFNNNKDTKLSALIFKNLNQAYTFLLNPDSAWYYDLKYRTISDSLSQIAMSEELLKYEAEFKSKEKDKEIELLQVQQELNAAKLKSRNTVIYTIGAFAFILLVLGSFLAVQRKQLRKSNKIITKSRKKLAIANSNLHISNKAREKLLSIIAHDLRGPVGGLKELLDLYIEMDQFDHEEIKSLLSAVRESSASTYHLLENLLSWANTQRGDILVDTETVNVKEIIDNTTQVLHYSSFTKHITLNTIIPSNLNVHADHNLLRVVLRNLISNAIKFSSQFGTIQIRAEQKSNSVIISVKDAGEGMSRKEIATIFEKKEEFFVNEGNSGNKGSGLGLILCKEFVEKMDGKIWVDEECSDGCKFNFSLPVGQIKTKANAFASEI